MGKQKLLWCCKECGHTQIKWTGSCSACQKWNTFIQEVEFDEKADRFFSLKQEISKAFRITEVKPGNFSRIFTGIAEFDRLLGGGLVIGSLSLIGGDPGIGKSTLMLHISENLSKQGLTVLYVCGEESVEQTFLRAQRIGAKSEKLYLLSETLFSRIKQHVEEIKPDILIVDSIQILYKEEIPSSPGSVTQVREIAMELMHLSKQWNISTFMIGHVTKSGEIAGPKVLEHIVDTVLDFEGDRQHGFRILRAVKNRFGPTDEIAIFQMNATGLSEVENPSLLFLQERMQDSAGSAIIPTIEGSRALLIEVQALVAKSTFSTSSRRSSGLDQNRLALLLAVLEKRMGYMLYNADVFVSIAGGLKIFEPAIDLGILLAISSSFCNRCIDAKTVLIGEVGLGGEVRSVPRIESRIKEAINMGFQTCLLPKRNLAGLSKELCKKIDLQGIDFVEDAVHLLLRDR
ncbi:MAG: DNA repair protein RadA [Chlamydiae bacterium]|nr:DNA repair protein RadA [Chlamydiota bacterium]